MIEYKIVYLPNKYLLIIDEKANPEKGKYGFYNGEIGIWDCISPTNYVLHLFNRNAIQLNYGVILAHLPLNNSPFLNGVDLLPKLQENWNTYTESDLRTAIFMARERTGVDWRYWNYQPEEIINIVKRSLMPISFKPKMISRYKAINTGEFVLDIHDGFEIGKIKDSQNMFVWEGEYTYEN